MNVALTARRLVAQAPGHPVISLYLDLDPENFATPPARASQIRSLTDQAARELEERDLGHDDRTALREDLDRVRDYLLSDEPPFQGARALAVFCSSRDDLFETVQLQSPVSGRVVVEPTPHVGPLLDGAQQQTWCVALVNRRVIRVLAGPSDGLEERQSEEDNVHGDHQQGGWSQARYERSVEKDVDEHLGHAAGILYRRWRRERFDRVVLGGPAEIVPRLEGMLSEELRPVLVSDRVEVDVATANADDVQAALAPIVEADEQRSEQEALDRLGAGIGGEGRAVGGPEATLEALNERRVETLLLAPDFDRPSARCPSCGLLVLTPGGAGGSCPADGTELEPVEHLREAAIEAALTQDAGVMVVRHHPNLGPFEGIAALLRF